jgi:hypothetical protein
MLLRLKQRISQAPFMFLIDSVETELIQLLLGELFSHKVALASLLSDSHSAI